MASRLLKVLAMAMEEPTARPPRLCYLKSDQIRGPLKSFDHLEVKNGDDQAIGRLDGIVIDAVARRVRYFVVEQGFLHRRRYLWPLSPASIDASANILRMDVAASDVSSCERFNPEAYRRYADEDVIAAMFHGYDDEEPGVHA